MKPKIDWPNHLISFVLVVLSILMAFQLEKCSDDRREDKLVEAHVKEIVEETRYNKSNLVNLIDKLKDDQFQLDTLLQLIHSEEEDLQRINNLVFRMMNVGGLYLKKNAFVSFTESGDIRFVDDFEEKTNLVQLYEFYKLAEVQNQLLVESFNERYFKHVSEKLDLYRARPQPIENYRDRVFINSISSYRYFLTSCLRTYERCLGYMDKYIQENAENV
ncbi:hypothetical protein [Neolewinella agarilytica]|uniref:Uncharacterized protein n=1 Tax=Neolewinella agarilytica TaxID=478744 RepID=A0A1H9DW44_9BACT|nr:hypothetical protein [Neolewinella agarilytica]SEQ17602.1 hypothetical protein SAMN05444359_106152 [Neolewinella agarilytica]